MTGHDLQSAIIAQVKKLVPVEKNFAAELAAVLGIGVNAAYKRIEGKTALTLDDLAKLAQYCYIPWQQLLRPNSPTVNMQFSGFAAKNSCVEYLQLLEQELALLRRAKSPEIWFLTVGLPDFHLFHFEELALFQLYFWERMAWGSPQWQEKKFSLNPDNNKELLALTKRVVNHYVFLEATEFWNDHILDSFLHQIAYVYESRLFENPGDLSILHEKLLLLVDHLENMAKQGKRYSPGGTPSEAAAPWHLFFNEIMRNNILLLVKTMDEEVFYAVMNNPHFIKSHDATMIEYANALFKTHIERSFPLGKNGEKHRGAFFDRLRSRIKAA